MGSPDEVIRERLRGLRSELAYLKSEKHEVRSFQAYAQDARLKRAVERSLQVAIGACLDIGRRLIAREGFRYPEDNADVFWVLAEHGIVPSDLLPRLIDMARFRNVVVHDYVQVDDAIVYGILKKHLGDFEAFARVITEYLRRSRASSR